MKKSHNKRMIGVVLVFLAIVSVFSLYSIYAVDQVDEAPNVTETPEAVDSTACELKDKVDLKKLLGLSIKDVVENGNHKFELVSSINSTNADYKKELKNLNLVVKRVNRNTSGFPVGEKLQAGGGDSGKITFSSNYDSSKNVNNIEGNNIGQQTSLPLVMYVELEASNVGSILGKSVFKNPSACSNGVLHAEVYILSGGGEATFTTDDIPINAEKQKVADELQKQIDKLNESAPSEVTNKEAGVDYTTNIDCTNVSKVSLDQLTANLVYDSSKAVKGFVDGTKAHRRTSC